MTAMTDNVAWIMKRLRGTIDKEIPQVTRGEAADALESLAAQVAERDAEIARLKDSLGVMYDRYDDGVDCHEGSDGDSLGSYIGKAVQLTKEEENKILALIPPHRPAYPKEPT